jgi:small-conductance mechanosensitive channel
MKPDFWSHVNDFFISVQEILSKPLFWIDKHAISAGTLLYIVLAIIILLYLSRKFSNFLTNRIFQRVGMDAASGKTIANISRFIIISLGLIVILQSAGINLSALTVAFGALGVGIGFGLQTITNNFISGIIIVFEKPIKVGDRIELDEVNGKVVNISIRATTVLTNDNVSIIVPNSEFVSSRVINWSHNDKSIRFRFPVGVSYREDPAKVKEVLLQVANENEHVLKSPIPEVFFDEFGDSSLNFNLAVWTSTMIDNRTPLKSQIYFAIFEKFKEHNIEIPFPQRDLHLRSSDIDLTKK